MVYNSSHKHIELERGLVINPGDYYTFNFTLIAPCTNTTCNLTARMSRYAYATQKYQGIKFGDIAWEIVVVSDQNKQGINSPQVNTIKGHNSLVYLNGSARNKTLLTATSQRFVTLPIGKETPSLQRNTSDLYTARIGDFNRPQNMTSLSTGVLNAAESRFPANSKGQGIPIYPPGGNVSIDNAKNGYEPGILGNYNNLEANRTYMSRKPVAGQRDYLTIIPPAVT